VAEIREDVVFVDDDAGDESLFHDGVSGSVVSSVVSEKLPGKLAEQASGFWSRAKAGYEKGKLEHEHGAYHEFTVAGEDGAQITGDGVRLSNVKVGAWERLSSLPQTVAGVVGYRTTGTAHASAGVLVKEELVAVEVPKPRPIPDLMHDATEEVSGLVRSEIALVKTEMKQKAKIIGPAVGLLVVALALLLLALPFILWAAVFALGLVLPLWAAALIMFALMLVVAAGLGLVALKRFKKLGNIKSLAGGSIKEDIHAIVEAFKTRNWATEQEALKEGRL